jgi:hypothetical protein
MAQIYLFEKTENFIIFLLMAKFITGIMCKRAVLLKLGSFIKFTKIYFAFLLYIIYIYIKESHKRPGVARRVPGGLGSQVS